MSWTWLIAPVLGLLAIIFGWDARRSRQALGVADEKRRSLERRVAEQNQMASHAAVSRPTLGELDRMLSTDADPPDAPPGA